MLISKTFDSSVICPAEQTCVVDEAIYDDAGRRVRAPGRAAARARPGGGPRRPRLRAGRAGRRPRPRPVLRQPRGDGRVRGGGRGEGAARPAALRPRRARRPPPDPGEADARPRAGPLALGRSRRQRLRADHRARRARSHLGRLRLRRLGDRPLRQPGPHRAHPGQRADRGRRPRRDLQLAHPDLLARLRHLGGLQHHRQRQLQEPAQREDRLAPPGASPVVPRPIGHLHQRGRDREPARGQGLAGPAGHRHRRRGARRGRRGAPLPRGPERPRLLGPPPGADRGADPGRHRGAGRVRRRLHRRGGGRLGAGRGEGDAALPREPRRLAAGAVAALPRRAQAGRPLPGGRAHGPAAGAADHRRDRIGGLARDRDQRAAGAR